MSDICLARHRANDDVTQTALRATEQTTTSHKLICAPSRKRRRHANCFARHREIDDVTQMDLRATRETDDVTQTDLRATRASDDVTQTDFTIPQPS